MENELFVKSIRTNFNNTFSKKKKKKKNSLQVSNILFKILNLLKEIIMIIKTYHKITIDITQIVDRHM